MEIDLAYSFIFLGVLTDPLKKQVQKYNIDPIEVANNFVNFKLKWDKILSEVLKKYE